ncbi:MAG: methyltransferase domain-containing protein [Dehalococcoidia bacterium]
MTGPRARSERPLYMAHVAPGLSELAWEEIAEHAPGSRRGDVWTGVDRRADVLLFHSSAPPASLLELRLVEDVFAVAGVERPLSDTKAGVRAITKLARTAEALDRALSTHRLAAAPKLRARPSYRVVARKSGQHTFRRSDAQHACELGLAQRFPRWRPVEDSATLEFWLQVIDTTAILALRLSSASMRHRTNRGEQLEGALKPTIAHALVRLARVRSGGLLADPACGSGTLLMEARDTGLRVLGGDADRRAVRAARANVDGPVAAWDARRLPLRAGAVDGIATNLPWGKTHSSRDLTRLYRRLLEEARRVLRPRGRVALLVADRQLVERLAREVGGYAVERSVRIVVKGADAWLIALRKRD